MPINYENGIKRPNQEIQFTKEMVLEFAKAAKDVRYFAENYFYILHPTKGKMRISLYDFQKEMVRNFQDHRFNVVLSARQMGKCLEKQQLVEILDTTNGKVEKITISDFFKMCEEEK
jgi:intein-encoded DNA endonuclease-like protein